MKNSEEDMRRSQDELGAGSSALLVGDLAAAEAHFRAALKLDAGLVEAWERLGHCLRAQNNLEEACTCFEQAVELDPTSPYGRLGLGHVLDDLGRDEEAERVFRDVAESNPAPIVLSHFGDFLATKGRLAEAEEYLKRALRTDGGYVPALRYYGTLLSALDRDEEAEEVLRRALRLDPDGQHTLYALGRFLSQFPGKRNQALDLLLRAAKAGDPRAVAVIEELTDHDG